MKTTSLNAVSNKAIRIVAQFYRRQEDTIKVRRPAKAARAYRRGARAEIQSWLMEAV